MTSPFDEHVQAVGFAGLEVEELENQLMAIRGTVGSVLMTVINAVGPDPVPGAGSEALGCVLEVNNLVKKQIRLCEKAKNELNRYGRGFTK